MKGKLPDPVPGTVQAALSQAYVSKVASLADQHVLTILLDRSGKIVRFNPLCEQFSGYDTEEAVGSYLTDYIDDTQSLQHILEQGDFPYQVSLVFHQKTGASLAIQWSFDTLTADNQMILMMGTPATDIQYWHRLVEDQNEMICRHRADGTIIFANRAYRQYFDRTSENLVGRRFLPKIPWPDRLLLRSCRASMTPSNPTMVFEHQVSMHGDIRWNQWQIRGIFDRHGSLTEYHSVGTDITDRKDVQEALREAEMRYRTIADFTYDWEYWINPNGTLRYVSPSCERITGYTAQQFLDNPALLQSIILPEDMEVWLQHSHSSPDAPPLREIQFRIRRGDGAVRWIEHACQPVVDDSDTFVGFRASNRDVTERKHAEIALRESEERFRNMADTAPVLIWMSGLDKRCFYFNQGWLDFTGRSHLEEMGDGWIQGIHPDDRERVLHRYHTSFGVRQPFRIEYRLRHRDGRYRWVLDNAIPRMLPDGTFTGYIGSCIDITERKEAETEREQLIGDLRTFGATVAHDLKNPVNNLIKIGQVLEMIGPDHEQYHEFVSYVIDSGETMQHIINSLLLLAGVRELEVEQQPLQMNQIVQQALARLQPEIELSDARITHPDEWPIVRGYAPWIEEVWVNYLDNAIQYGGNPPLIELGAAPTETGARFWVRDNGNGLDPAQQARLFAPFTRLDSANQKGHGLGLSIVKRIVEKLGGQVGVTSQIGAGCEFFFTLPTD